MNHSHSWLESYKILGNIVTGLYSSGIFLLVLSFLKPRIKICDKISFIYNKNGVSKEEVGSKKYTYFFKIVNKSIFFRVYDVQIRVWSTETKPSHNSDDTYFKEIVLVKNYQWVINRLYIWHVFQNILIGERRLLSRTDYAAQFSTHDNLKSMIEQGRSITIELIAKHSLTGFTRVINKTYKHSADINKGSFLSGNSCRIK